MAWTQNFCIKSAYFLQNIESLSLKLSGDGLPGMRPQDQGGMDKRGGIKVKPTTELLAAKKGSRLPLTIIG